MGFIHPPPSVDDPFGRRPARRIGAACNHSEPGRNRRNRAAFGGDQRAARISLSGLYATIEYRAIEEGLKPFQDRRIQSVAGIEMGFNANKNFLTRLQCSLQLYAQAVIGAAWSVAGDMFTNRGPYALYRAEMIRNYLAVYRDEVFLGRRVILGDDSLLALCGSADGRSVQQLTAIGLTMWPETYGHHLRQRLRWARGRAVRNFWRVRYRPVLSYCWWFTVLGIQGFLTSVALFVLLITTWPLGEPVLVRALIALLILSVVNGLRTLCFKRSDETFNDRLILILIRPLSTLWSGIVLSRFVRSWGTMTLLKQGWTTRQKGAELVLSPAGYGEPAAATQKVSSGYRGRLGPAALSSLTDRIQRLEPLKDRLAEARALWSILAAQATLTLPWIWRTAAYTDEALYLSAAHQGWSQLLADASTYPGLPVIYPTVAGALDSVGGLIAARLLSLVFMLGATRLIYMMGDRMFGRIPGLLAALQFAVCGIIVHLGAAATFDPMSLFLLVLALYGAVRMRDGGLRWLVVCPLALAAANATKYATIAWAPLVVGAITLYGWSKGRLQSLFLAGSVLVTTAVIDVAILMLGGANLASGILVNTIYRSPQAGVPSSTLSVLSHALLMTGLIILIALGGIWVSLVKRMPVTATAMKCAASRPLPRRR